MIFYIHYQGNPFKKATPYFSNQGNYYLNLFKRKSKRAILKKDKRINLKNIGLQGIKGLSIIYDFKYREFINKNFHITPKNIWLIKNGHKHKMNLLLWCRVITNLSQECKKIQEKSNVSRLIQSKYRKYITINIVKRIYHPRKRKFVNNAREKLGKLGTNKRYRFASNFVRFGSKSNGQLTILLINIFHNNDLITKHLWFNATKAFKKLGNLNQGDIILFTARVKKYKKGYIPNSFRKLYDYKLAYPTHIKKIRM